MKKIIALIMAFCLTLCNCCFAEIWVTLGEEEFLNQLNTLHDMEQLQIMFEENNAHIKMRITEPSIYYNLDGSGLTRFYRDIMENRPYTSIEAAKERLEFFVVLEYINTSKYPQIEEALSYAEEDYDLNLSDLYKLCDEHKEQALTEFAKYHSHNTMAEIQHRMDTILKKYLALEAEEKAAMIPLDKIFALDEFNLEVITVSDWAENEILRASKLLIIPSGLDTDYTLPITREKFCEIAYLAAAKTKKFNTEYIETPFEDTNNEAVVMLQRSGIILGTDETHFSPEKEITREESAVIVHRLAEFLGIETDNTDYNMISDDYLFNDHEEISDWAKQQVYSLKRSNVMNGVGENRFAPGEIYTAEQALAVILRTCF